MNWPKEPNFVEENNRVVMRRPTLFSCGCGSTIARLATILPQAGINHFDLDQAKPTQHELAKRYLEENDYYNKIPALAPHTFGVLISPKGEWLDILAGSTGNVVERFKEICNG